MRRFLLPCARAIASRHRRRGENDRLLTIKYSFEFSIKFGGVVQCRFFLLPAWRGVGNGWTEPPTEGCVGFFIQGRRTLKPSKRADDEQLFFM